MSDPLSQLQPIHLPAEITWWPPAPGWWVLLLLLLVLIWSGWRYRQIRRPQRAALKALRHIQKNGHPLQQQLSALNQLLKRYILSSRPQHDEAALSGEAWLQLLDSQSRKPGFLTAPGRLLLTLPYSVTEPQAESRKEDAAALFALSRHWIRRNPPQRGNR